jgi:hypothetical protein
MPRSLTSAALAAIYAQETGDWPIQLLTITHPALISPLYLSDNPMTRTSDANGQPYYKTTSNGIDYLFLPFELSLPDDDSEKIQTAKLTLDNIDLSIVQAVREMGTTPAQVTIALVMQSAPDTTVMSIGPLAMRDVTYDATAVTATLSFEQILNEPFPGDLVSPSTLPGVFLED